jgi:hypothetical protein
MRAATSPFRKPPMSLTTAVGARAYRFGMGYCRCCKVDNAIFSPPKQVNGLPMASRLVPDVGPRVAR